MQLFSLHPGRRHLCCTVQHYCGLRLLSGKCVESSSGLQDYCDEMSTPLHPVLERLQADTVARAHNPGQQSARQVLQLNSLLIRGLGARRVLDIGVFTGSSALAAALALPGHGTVLALEKSTKYAEFARKYWREAGVEDKIELITGPALETLDSLINAGESESIDFAYIDADKKNYPEYFVRCVELVRPGGYIALDNTLFRGAVVGENSENINTVKHIKRANQTIRSCPQVHAVLLNIGDGYTLTNKINR